MLTEHMKDHTDDKHYEHPRCVYKIFNASDMKIRRSTKQRTKKEFACDTCESMFRSNALFEEHHTQCVSAISSSSSSNLPPVTNSEVSNTCYICNACKAQFLSDDLLALHVNDFPCVPLYSKSAHEFGCRSSPDLSQVSSVDNKSPTSSVKSPVTNVDEVSNTCYYCNVCKARFSSEDLLVQHVNDFPCAPLHSQCAPEIGCRSSADLVSNVVKESDPCSYVCDVCEAQFFSEDLLAQHMSKHLNDPQAEAKFDSKNSLRVHPYKHKNRKRFECPFCDKKFAVQYLLKEHMRVHTGEKPFECETCGKKFSHRYSLRDHSQRLHDGNSPANSVEDGPEEDYARYKCPKCDEEFPAMPRLKTHLRVQHNVKCSYTCTSCNLVFMSTSQLRKHNRICAPENLLSCNVCETKFSNKRLLQRHLSKHRAEKRFECGVCERKFSFEYLLREHLPKHTGEKPFECDKCDKKFAYRASLRVHQRLAHGDGSVEEDLAEDHECDICGKTFRKRQLLQVHLWKHKAKEEKRFKCSLCPKKFTYNYEMVRHLGGHAGEKKSVVT